MSDIGHDNPYNGIPGDKEEWNWRSVLAYVAGALLMLLIGFIGSGVIG